MTTNSNFVLSQYTERYVINMVAVPERQFDCARNLLAPPWHFVPDPLEQKNIGNKDARFLHVFIFSDCPAFSDVFAFPGGSKRSVGDCNTVERFALVDLSLQKPYHS